MLTTHFHLPDGIGQERERERRESSSKYAVATSILSRSPFPSPFLLTFNQAGESGILCLFALHQKLIWLKPREKKWCSSDIYLFNKNVNRLTRTRREFTIHFGCISRVDPSCQDFISPSRNCQKATFISRVRNSEFSG